MAKNVKNKTDNSDYYSVDIFYVLKLLWSKIILIMIIGIICGICGFALAKFAVKPMYSSKVAIYVNNSSVSLGGANVNLNDITAARSLVDTYIKILEKRSTLQKVISKTKVPYTYEQLLKMIDAYAEDGTEIFDVVVTSYDNEEATMIANAISEVLETRISEVVKGSEAVCVDEAVTTRNKVSPSITKYTAIGFVIGVVIVCLIIIIRDLLDDIIHDSEYVVQNYDAPVLARIPNLLESDADRYKKHNREQYYNLPVSEEVSFDDI